MSSRRRILGVAVGGTAAPAPEETSTAAAVAAEAVVTIPAEQLARQVAVQAALQLRTGAMQPRDVIVLAQVFETYVLTGEVPAVPEAPPAAEEKRDGA